MFNDCNFQKIKLIFTIKYSIIVGIKIFRGGIGVNKDFKSRVMRTSRVFPNDVNNHNTLFGGRLMSDIDQVASISAAKHSRKDCVTASTESVYFESYVNVDRTILYGSLCKSDCRKLENRGKKGGSDCIINLCSIR